MDARCKKPKDFVAITKNLTEETKKIRSSQMRWFQKYEKLLNEYEKLQREMKELCEEKYKIADDSLIIRNGRTCLPTPITTNNEYGWLAQKPNFRLEKYGSCIIDYPDPLKNITLLSGNVPTLATGKGFLR